jgi:DNA repair protein RadD
MAPTRVVAVTAPTLRDYQVENVDQIRAAYADGARRVCFQLPTGGGKRVVFSYILASAARRGKRVLVLCHRREIFEQAEASVLLADVDYGKIAPDCTETDAPVQIAMVATLAQSKRLERAIGLTS